MATIEEFIQNNLGKPNVAPKLLLMEAYAMGVSHGKGEEYEIEEVVEEEVEEEEEVEVPEAEVKDFDEEEEEEEDE